ncbi:MAG: polysulfide reductase, partial [Streptosporangiaceae bacterium]
LEHRPGLAGEPYREGSAGQALRAARWLTPAGGVVSLAAGRSRIAAIAAAGLLTGGALATRFGVFRAGVASAADPKYVVASQRPVTDGPGGG